MNIAAIALSLVLQTGPSYTIGGDKVPVQVPTWTNALPMEVVESGGWKYGISDGRLVAKGIKGLGWEDVPATEVQSSTRKRILFNLVTKTDSVTNIGFLWQRQGNLFTDDFRAFKREVALFCHLANTMAPSHPIIEPIWRVDETTRLIDSQADLGRGYLETFMNATTERPAVGLGPMDFTFVLNPSYDDVATFDSIDGNPCAVVPAYAAYDKARPGQLARAMYNVWMNAGAGSKTFLAGPLGVGALPLDSSSTTGLAAYGGALPTDSYRSVAFADGKLFVRPPFVEVATSKLSRPPIGQAGGWVVFDGAGTANGLSEAQMLGLETKASPPSGVAELAFTPGQAEQLFTSGNFSIKTAADPERGAVGELKEMSVRRKGWLRLLGPFDGAQNGTLEFWIRPRGIVWPIDLVVLGDGRSSTFRLFGSSRTLPNGLPLPAQTGVTDLDLKTDASWQRIAVKHGIQSVQGVFLTTPLDAGFDEMPRSGLPVLMLDDVAAKPSAELSPTKQPEAPADSAYMRAITAASSTDEPALIKMLEDPSDVVRLNAAARFKTIKNPASVPGLTMIARHYNPRLAEVGAKALANQGTEAAWGALRYNYQNALGDYVKEFTAQVIPSINDRKILSELALAINSRRPETRAAAARAIAKQPFKEAALVMLTFLSDADAIVRAAAIEAYPEKQATALERIIMAARTDGSDLVRAAAFKKLKQWSIPEAANAAKDPSPRVRASQ